MKIGLLGHGVVGSGVRKIIDERLQQGDTSISVKRILVKDTSEITEDRMTLDVNDILNDDEIDLVCECMGGIEPARSFLLEAVKRGKHVVTSNKKMLANAAEELFTLAKEKNVYVGFEASVGGGIPWIHEISRTRRIDTISQFEGIFNGTTNYILSQMSKEGKEFDEMLANAQSLGYAERDPSDDIDGYDVRYKTALSTLASFDICVQPEDIITYGIRYISSNDIAYAKNNNRTVKLIGKGSYVQGNLRCSVLPTMVKNDSFFANIPLNFNAVQLDSDTLGKAVYIGQGAGSLPTAHAVVQDIIDIACRENLSDHTYAKAVLTHEKEDRVFYIHSHNIEKYNAICDEKVDENTIITKAISLRDVNECIAQNNDTDVFLAEVEQ